MNLFFGDIRAERALHPHENLDGHSRLIVRLYCKTDIKDAVTVRADKKPSGCIAILFENVVEAVFISTLRTLLKLVFEFDLFYVSIHLVTCFTLKRKGQI